MRECEFNRALKRIKAPVSCRKEHPDALPDIPDTDGKYVSWMNLAEHYRARLPSLPREVFAHSKPRGIIASARLCVCLSTVVTLKISNHLRLGAKFVPRRA